MENFRCDSFATTVPTSGGPDVESDRCWSEVLLLGGKHGKDTHNGAGVRLLCEFELVMGRAQSHPLFLPS